MVPTTARNTTTVYIKPPYTPISKFCSNSCFFHSPRPRPKKPRNVPERKTPICGRAFVERLEDPHSTSHYRRRLVPRTNGMATHTHEYLALFRYGALALFKSKYQVGVEETPTKETIAGTYFRLKADRHQ